MLKQASKSPIQAVIFDMDGVLVDSEVYWQQSREEFAREIGKVWRPEDQRRVMGVSTLEWAEIMRERLEVDRPLEDIIADIKARMFAHYKRRMPILPGALEAVHKAAARYKVGLASGSETSVIKLVMEETGLGKIFNVVIYGDTVPRGKPSPDIYLEAARQLGIPPEQAVGVEDSANGIRALKAAGMRVIAVPGQAFPLSDEVLQLADVTLTSLEAFSIDLVQSL
jgi:beta-phosphoglucomutase-like phosphatase (HAD superfamily)